MVSALIPALGLSYIYQESGCIFNTIIAHGLSGGPYVLLSYIFVYLNLGPERKEEESIL